MDLITLALSKKYTDKKIESLANAGFTPEIVSTLPAVSAANPSTIYLVPSTKSEEGNSYSEYLVINGKWECIGSTGVDLSNYSTKQYVDDSIAAASNSYVVEANLGDAYFADASNFRSASSALIPHILKATKNGTQRGVIIATTYQGMSIIHAHCNGSTSGVPTYQITGVQIQNQADLAYSYIHQFAGTYTIRTDGTLATSTYTDSRTYNPELILQMNNTKSYTPTHNYNPATKKYVDDKIGEIEAVLATLTTPSSEGGN